MPRRTQSDLFQRGLTAADKISDTGKGMSEASLEKIFNPFFTTKTKGTGLGLSICKRLIEQHGGNIEVHSSVDSGTSFVITLPLRQFNRE